MKSLRRLLWIAFCMILTFSCMAAEIPAPSEVFYVLDNADVLSEQTKTDIITRTERLESQTGAQLCVVTVEFIGSARTADFAYELFNKWGIGDVQKDNGVLILLVTGAEDYYMLQGEGLEGVLPSSTLQELLDEYMEPDFARGDYNAAAYSTANAVLNRLADYYGVSLDGGNTLAPSTQQYPMTQMPEALQWEEQTPTTGILTGIVRLGGFVMLIAIGIIILVFAVIINAAKGIGRSTRGFFAPHVYRPYGFTRKPGMFWNGYPPRHAPPPPRRNPPSGGWNAGSRSAGFHSSGFHSAGGGFHSSGGAGRSGGFGAHSGGGGHSRGGGAGRH